LFGAVGGVGLEDGEGVGEELEARVGLEGSGVIGTIEAVEEGGEVEEFGAGFEEVGVEERGGGGRGEKRHVRYSRRKTSPSMRGGCCGSRDLFQFIQILKMPR
jgi:hypothetical protein